MHQTGPVREYDISWAWSGVCPSRRPGPGRTPPPGRPRPLRGGPRRSLCHPLSPPPRGPAAQRCHRGRAHVRSPSEARPSPTPHRARARQHDAAPSPPHPPPRRVRPRIPRARGYGVDMLYPPATTEQTSGSTSRPSRRNLASNPPGIDIHHKRDRWSRFAFLPVPMDARECPRAFGARTCLSSQYTARPSLRAGGGSGLLISRLKVRFLRGAPTYASSRLSPVPFAPSRRTAAAARPRWTACLVSETMRRDRHPEGVPAGDRDLP